MPPLFWFLVGVATALAMTTVIGPLRKRLRSTNEPPPPSPPARPLGTDERLELRLARLVLDDTSRDLESLATGVGDQLATMSSTIQGRGQLLCEAIGEPEQVAHRAEQLTDAIHRLRLFSEKILSFSQVENLELEAVDIRKFLTRLASDVHRSGAVCKVDYQAAASLPIAMASPRALRNAVLFLLETLLHLENRASRIHVSAYPQVHEEGDTRIDIEISAENDHSTVDPLTPPGQRSIQLGYIAARNLLEAQNARLSFDELEGLRVTCIISLAAADPAELVDTAEQPTMEPIVELPKPEKPIGPALPPHDYGGVLILEEDAHIRDMIAAELAPTGRKLVTCVDGASARSLIEATPERFELVVVEEDARLESGDRIARLAAERIPGIKILILSTGTQAKEPLPNCRSILIAKPFGVAELREAFQELVPSAAIS